MKAARRSVALFGFPLKARRKQIARSHWGRRAKKRAAQLIPLKGAKPHAALS